MTSVNCNIVESEVADEFIDRSLIRMRELGQRITSPKKSVLRVLAGTRRPLGAYQIRDEVVSLGNTIDVVSVYRILSSLLEVGLVHRIGSLDGYLACTGRHSSEFQCQHLICRQCGCVEEIPVPQQALTEIGASSSRFGFLSDTTLVEVLGICSHCR